MEVKKEVNSPCSWKLKRTILNSIVPFNSHFYSLFNSHFNSLLILSFLLILPFATQAQVPISIRQLPKSTNSQQPTANSGQPTASNTDADTLGEMPKGIVYHTDLPDSVLTGSVFAFHHRPYEVKIMEVSHPRFDPTGVHAQILTSQGHQYLDLGLGHPHIAVWKDFSDPIGVAFKPCIYPAYYKTPENISFYQVQRPYSLLAYHSSIDKDYQLHVTHTQNITERWNFALDYHLFSPEGVYSNSSAVDHLLDFNTNYYSRDGRYQLRAGAIWQQFTLGENGGLTDDDLFIYHRSRPAGLPVVSSSASSRASDLTLFASQTFNTVRQVPWLRERPAITPASPDSSGSSESQNSPASPDTLYPSEPRILNSGVFGLDLRYDRHKYIGVTLPATQYDSLLNHRFSGTLFWTNDAYLDHRWRNPLKITLGVRPYLASVDLDTARYDTTRITHTKIYPFARVIIAPWAWGELNLLAETEPFTGEYNLDALLSLNPTHLFLRASLKASSADDLFEIQRRIKGVSCSEIPLMKVARVEATYHYGDLIDISLAANHIQNYHYFIKVNTDPGSGQTAIVPSVALSTQPILLQARIELNLQAWDWLHYDMQQLLQYSTQDVVRVPLWASQNSIYADFHLFHRALRTQVGVDVRYHTSFYADSYNPSLGLFYRQDETLVGNYIYADFFINLQVKRASIYLKVGHWNSLLESESHSFALPHYPDNPFGVLYGLVWQFFD